MEYRPRAAPGRDLGGLGDDAPPPHGANVGQRRRLVRETCRGLRLRQIHEPFVAPLLFTTRKAKPRDYFRRVLARAHARSTTHTLENVRICERKERRITYVVKKMCLERTRAIIIQFRDFPNVRITFADNVRTANARRSRTAHVPSDAPRNTRTCERLRTDCEHKRKQGSPAPKGKTPLSFIPSARRTRRHGRRTPCGTCRSRRASRLSA